MGKTGFLVFGLFFALMSSGVANALSQSPMDLSLSLDEIPYLDREVELTVAIFSSLDALDTLVNITADGLQIEKGLWNISVPKNKTEIIRTKIKSVQTGNLSLMVFAKHAIKNQSWFGDIKRLYIEVTENNASVSEHRKIPRATKAKKLKIKPMQKEIKTLSDGYIYIYGYFCYDVYCNLPAFDVTVYAYDEDELLLYGDEYLGSGITDINGYFEIGPILNLDYYGTFLDPYVEYVSGSSVASVETDEFSLTYSVFSETQWGVSQDAYFENYIPLTPGNGAWIIYSSLVLAWYHVASEGYTLPKIIAKWPDTAFGGWYVEPDGAYYIPGGYMYLGADVYLSPDVVMHEYGHFVMYKTYGNWVPDTQCPSPHWITSKSNKVCAWTEGWANFFPLAVQGKSNFEYYGHYNIDFEHLITTLTSTWDLGDDVEGNVAASLYDLFDSNNDDYDTISAGFTPIWNVFSSKKRSIFSEFWGDWNLDKPTAKKILFQNYIDYDAAPTVTLISPLNNSVSEPVFQWYSYDTDDTLLENRIYIANASGVIIDESLGTSNNYSTTLPYGIYGWMIEVSDGLKSTFSDIWTFIYPPENITLSGYVFNTDNETIPNVTVELEDYNETVWFANKTDGNGYFEFSNLLWGFYELYVNDEHLLEDYTTVAFGDENMIYLIGDIEINITLLKINASLEFNVSSFKNGDTVEANVTVTNNENFNLTDWAFVLGVWFENETYYEEFYFNLTPINISAGETKSHIFVLEIPENNTYSDFYVYGGTGTENWSVVSSEGNLTTLIYKIDEKEVSIVILPGDADGNCKVDIFDLAKVGLCYGCSSPQECWTECKRADVKPNGKIDIFDLATIGLNYGNSC